RHGEIRHRGTEDTEENAGISVLSVPLWFVSAPSSFDVAQDDPERSRRVAARQGLSPRAARLLSQHHQHEAQETEAGHDSGDSGGNRARERAVLGILLQHLAGLAL